jgi:hypothetical protein
MDANQLTLRLNATERLSAEDAGVVAFGWNTAELRDALKAYAAALEGEHVEKEKN